MPRLLIAFVSLFLVGLVVAGCGTSGSSSTTNTTATVPAARLGAAATKRTVTLAMQNPTSQEARWSVGGSTTTLRAYERKELPVTMTGTDITLAVVFGLHSASRGLLQAIFTVKVVCTDTCRTTIQVRHDDFGGAKASASASDAPYIWLQVG